MTLIRRSENYPTWSNLISDIFNNERNDLTLTNYSLTNTTLPSINIMETENGFELEMAAPGLEKKDFKIEVDKGILSISSERKTEKEDVDSNRYTRREFSYQSFFRSFALPTSVDSDRIGAKYENGILKVIIPKREEAKPKPVKMIDIE